MVCCYSIRDTWSVTQKIPIQIIRAEQQTDSECFKYDCKLVRFQVLTAANMNMTVLCCVVWEKLTDISEVLIASIIRASVEFSKRN
jgi:hypothetical protein